MPCHPMPEVFTIAGLPKGTGGSYSLITPFSSMTTPVYELSNIRVGNQMEREQQMFVLG